MAKSTFSDSARQKQGDAYGVLFSPLVLFRLLRENAALTAGLHHVVT